MPTSTAAARAALNLHTAEHYFKRSSTHTRPDDRIRVCKEIACECYLAGLKIIQQEQRRIPRLDLIRLIALERRILINHILPS